MKTTACIKLLALLLLAACDRTSKLSFEGGAPGGVHTIADLKARCTANSVAVTEDITLEGVVTGNDFYGEFYKTLVVEDASGGISLLIDGTRLAFDYPVGAAVTIFCNGLTLGDYGGKIQLGTAPDGDYGVGRIPREELGRYLRRNPDKDRRPRPAVCTFDAIGPRQTDTYVCFEGVRFTEAGPWCDTDPETSEPQTSERTLTDAQGRTFRVRTLGTCAYATEPVPQGTGSVYGIIDYFNGKYTASASRSGASNSLTLQGFPEHILQPGDIQPRNRRNKDRGNAFGQVGFHLLDQLLVQHVALGDGQQTLLVEQFGIVLRQFAQQDFVIAPDVVAVGGNHEQQHRIALDMAQEAGAESAALVRPLDDAGNVGHDERFMVADLHDAQIGFERGEGIVGDLGFGSGNSREQRTLARIGEAHQSHVGQHFQFENESPFVALFARLGVARRLVGGAFEMPVAETSAAAMQQHQPLARRR